MSSFTATVSASEASEAQAKVARRLTDGFEAGRAQVRSERHLLWDVEVTVPEGASKSQRDDAWVLLTSYGISPSNDLGSVWQNVAGVGC